MGVCNIIGSLYEFKCSYNGHTPITPEWHVRCTLLLTTRAATRGLARPSPPPSPVAQFIHQSIVLREHERRHRSPCLVLLADEGELRQPRQEREERCIPPRSADSLIDIFSTFYIVLHTTSHTRTRHTTSPMQNARHIHRGGAGPAAGHRSSRASHAATNLKYCRVLQVYTAGRCRRHDPEQSVLSRAPPV